MTAEKPRVRQVIVVEGRYDRAAVLRAVDAVVVETGGFGVFHNRENAAYIRALAQKHGVILLTDSDGAGFVIRGKLRGMLGDVEIFEAYIPEIEGKERRKRAPSREGKIGVEGMSPEVILEALKRCGALLDGENGREKITKADLYTLGLSGKQDSAAKRDRVKKKLSLPSGLSANGFLDALNAFMEKDELIKILAEIEKEETDNV